MVPAQQKANGEESAEAIVPERGRAEPTNRHSTNGSSAKTAREKNEGWLGAERKGGKGKRMSLLEETLNEANLQRAVKAVMANGGAPGVDGVVRHRFLLAKRQIIFKKRAHLRPFFGS